MNTSIDIDDFKITPFTEFKDLPTDHDLDAKKSRNYLFLFSTTTQFFLNGKQFFFTNTFKFYIYISFLRVKRIGYLSSSTT